MRRKPKTAAKPASEQGAESITITIAPKLESEKTAAEKHSVTVDVNNKQTSLFIKKGECVNFDICTTNSLNCKYELVTNDFESCLIEDRSEVRNDGFQSQGADCLGDMKPFSTGKDQNGERGDKLDDPFKGNSKLLPTIRNEDMLGPVALPGNKIAKNNGLTAKAYEPAEVGSHLKTMGGEGMALGGKQESIEFKEDGMSVEAEDIIHEKLIRPSTVSEDYVRRLSKICTDLCGISAPHSTVEGSYVNKAKMCLGANVKELITRAFTPKIEEYRVPSKIIIPERSISFDILLQFYESK